jgi:hypothetical protein
MSENAAPRRYPCPDGGYGAVKVSMRMYSGCFRYSTLTMNSVRITLPRRSTCPNIT